MPLSVDIKQKKIIAPISDLVSMLTESHHGVGLFSQARSAIGNKIHAGYRIENQTQENFSSEVEVNLQHFVDEFEVFLRGRIDGLFDDGKSITVQEVKSVLMTSASLSRMRAEYFPDFSLQVRLYALAISNMRKNRKIFAELILVSVLDGESVRLRVELHPRDTIAQMEQLVREAIQLEEQNQQKAIHYSTIASRLSFPYPRLRPYQQEFMNTIQKGLESNRPILAMAPTGIGKTSAALFPTLRFCLQRNIPLLFLTSRTSQRQLVAKTFVDICQASGLEQDDLRCLTLRAKAGMCPPGHMLCHPESCEFLVDFQARCKRSAAIDRLLSQGWLIDPEKINAVGMAHRLCPFTLSRYLIDRVQLVIGDFNHAFDPSVVLEELYPSQEPGPVVIIDEAHNLFDRARNTWSPFVSRAEIGSLCSAIESGQYMVKGGSKQLVIQGMQSIVDGKGLFDSILQLLTDTDLECADTAVQAQEQSPACVEDCRPMEPHRESWHELAQRAMEAIVPYLLYSRFHGLARPDDQLLDFLTRLAKLGNLLVEPSKELVPYASGHEAPRGAGFGCTCVNPAPFLARRHAKASGTVAMSATLTPLDYFSDVLGFSSADPITTSLPSPFPEENLGVFITPHIDTRFKHRSESHDKLARTIEEVVQSKQGKYAVFFPSFKYLSDVRVKLHLDNMKIFVQLPGISHDSREKILNRFRNNQTPSVLLAVMGGAFGEGIDLPGDELIGAVIISPGLPKIGFERSLMQIYFQDEYERGFSYSMLYPGMQRVVQAAGRVIRSSDDRGVVVLVGKRFAEPPLINSLPPHWYSHIPKELICDDLTGMLASFWDS